MQAGPGDGVGWALGSACLSAGATLGAPRCSQEPLQPLTCAGRLGTGKVWGQRSSGHSIPNPSDRLLGKRRHGSLHRSLDLAMDTGRVERLEWPGGRCYTGANETEGGPRAEPSTVSLVRPVVSFPRAPKTPPKGSLCPAAPCPPNALVLCGADGPRGSLGGHSEAGQCPALVLGPPPCLEA